jgi:hypothetical protein
LISSAKAFYKIDDFQTRRLGSTAVAQTMNSGERLYRWETVWGNQVTTQLFCLYNGAESILMAYDRIKSGQAKRILAGSITTCGPISGVDLMRVCTFKHNSTSWFEGMSISASGFVPEAGAGALVLEDLNSLSRGAYLCRSARRKCKSGRTTWSQHDGAKPSGCSEMY